jgi:hypothetical protein
MTSSAENTVCYLPRLELPSWLNLYPEVADEAEALYDRLLKADRQYERQPAEARSPRYSTTLARIAYLSRLESDHWLPLPVAIADEAEALFDRVPNADQGHERQPAEARPPRYSTTLERIELLSRLASDQRMKSVWQELYRKRRGAKEFLNPVKRDDLFGEKFRTLHDPKNHDMAVRAVFRRVFRYAASPQRNGSLAGWFGDKR